METILISTENIKTNESHQLIPDLPQKLGVRSSNKQIALQNFRNYYTWKSKRQLHTNNKQKIITPTWNDESELPERSCSVEDILDYNEYLIKKHEKLPTNPPIHIYINRINDRLMFKIKDTNIS